MKGEQRRENKRDKGKGEKRIGRGRDERAIEIIEEEEEKKERL